MAGARRITQTTLRQVEWSPSFSWEVCFPSAPVPFDSWFPAIDVQEDISSLNTYKFEAFIKSFSFPQNSDELSVQLTFNDDINHTLSQWIRSWVEETIFGNGSHVVPLRQATRVLQLNKLNRLGESVVTKNYNVIPEGKLTFQGNSSSDLTVYSQNFVIVGESS